MIKTIFCANEQAEQAMTLSASPSGEIQATCPECGRVLKFPAGVKAESFNQMVTAHKADNYGQVTQESIEATLAALGDKIPLPVVEVQPAPEAEPAAEQV